jgi:transposase
LSTIRFEHPAQEIAFNEYRLASKEVCERVERITQALREQCENWRMNPVVKALMCLKGFDFVAAVTFVAEMGDLNRFAHPRALMSYLGLVPSEFSSGASRRQGGITKSGNKHARRILVEAAWNPLGVWKFAKRGSRRSSATSLGRRSCACPSAGAVF